jgi:type IV pilus assembly protein PilY1
MFGAGTMNAKGMSSLKLVKLVSKSLLTMFIVVCSGQVSAGPLNLADGVLEVSTGVEPNIVILNDDSGSMDHGVMAPKMSEGDYIYDTLHYQYVYPDPGIVIPVSGSALAPAANIKETTLVTVYDPVTPSNSTRVRDNSKDWGVVPTEASLLAKGLPLGGVWRARYSGFNQIYYNPQVTYKPWKGVDRNGVAYQDINPGAAIFDPYNPNSQITKYDLTAVSSYTTRLQCSVAAKAAGTCIYLWEFNRDPTVLRSQAFEREELTVTGFYPAHYYTWGTDTNSDGLPDASGDTNSDGLVDEAEPHSLIEIRSGGCSTGAVCPTSFKRNEFNIVTKAGRSDCASSNGDGTVNCTYNEEIQNFANWFSYYRKRDLTVKAAFSGVIEDATLGRIGYATLHDAGSVSIPVASMDPALGSTNKDTLFSKLFDTRPTGGTPLRENLHEVGNYFQCQGENIFGTAASNPGDANCPVQAAPHGNCQANHAVLITDGYYNGRPTNSSSNKNSSASFTAKIGNDDSDDDSDWDGGLNDAFGDAAFGANFTQTLADVAMYYYENDLHTTLSDVVRMTKADVDGYNGNSSVTVTDTMHQHMKTHTIGFGVVGSLNDNDIPVLPNEINTPGAWTDPTVRDSPEKIDDLRHAAFNGRGVFSNAGDPVILSKDLEKIFDVIGTGEGAASAVAFNSQTIQSDSLVFRAFFDIQSNSGDLVAQKIKADGTLRTDIFGDPIYEWSAADRLDSKTSSSSDSRIIITYDDNGTSSQGVPFQWNGSPSINTTQQAQLNADPSYASGPPVNVTPPTLGDKRLGYLRGHSVDEGLIYDDGEFRVRLATDGKLGDIVHSTPVYVGKPPFTRRNSAMYPGEFPNNVPDLYTTFKADNVNRDAVVYVGANDGMLHAFDADNGDELFAYVPNILFNKLPDLTHQDYNHQFYVDLTPSINDIFMVADGQSTASWNTVLVGGLGAGGKGYYALNITDPTGFNTESNAADNVMWEFTEADDGSIGNSDLGYSFSAPVIAMSNADIDSDGENDWVAIFGNGYNSTSTDGDAAIYIAFIEEGQDGVWTAGSDYIKIDTGNGKAESSDGATPNGIGEVRAVDTNGDGTVDVLYAGDLQGNLYRIDVTDTNESNWDSGGNQDIIFKARYGTSYPRSIVQPITKSPIVVEHSTQSGHIVIFATGSWMTTDDAISTDIQSIYGIWDDGSGDEVEMLDADNHLIEQVFTNHYNQEHGFTVRSLTNNAINWKNIGDTNQQEKGWYIDLDMPPATGSGIEYPGERAVRNLQLRGGLLFVNTIIPKSSNACSSGAGGFELGFNPETGGSGTKIIFDIDNDGVFDLSDNINDTVGDVNIVTGIRFDNATPSDAAFIGSYRLTQLSDKSVRSVATNTKGSTSAGRNSWREVIFH